LRAAPSRDSVPRPPRRAQRHSLAARNRGPGPKCSRPRGPALWWASGSGSTGVPGGGDDARAGGRSLRPLCGPCGASGQRQLHLLSVSRRRWRWQESPEPAAVRKDTMPAYSMGVGEGDERRQRRSSGSRSWAGTLCTARDGRRNGTTQSPRDRQKSRCAMRPVPLSPDLPTCRASVAVVSSRVEGARFLNG
jgi:hypothetical protein